MDLPRIVTSVLNTTPPRHSDESLSLKALRKTALERMGGVRKAFSPDKQKRPRLGVR